MSVHDEDDEKTSLIPSETFKGKLEAAGRTPPFLVVLMGPSQYMGQQWELTEPELLIGRSMKAQIQIDEASVSKSHAKVVVSNTGVSIIDLGSTNKTHINGNVLTPMVPVELGDNDQVQTGNVIFKYLAPGNLEAMSNQENFEKAHMDPLTGIYNKRALTNKGPEAIKRAKLLDESLSVIVFDIDHFKQVNDTYGHAAGDYVIKELSQVIKNGVIRGADFFARFGGEEFTLILAGSSQQQALEVAERARSKVEHHPFTFEGTTMPIRISLGVCSLSTDISSWDDIFKRADEALYRAKQNGRNQVSL